jgi:hypothetical protein
VCCSLAYVPLFCRLILSIDLHQNVKGSKGTFVDGERLIPEGLKSELHEFKSSDISVSP